MVRDCLLPNAANRAKNASCLCVPKVKCLSGLVSKG